MVKINIGTAGWDYKDWVGSFYPGKLERNQHLAYYANYFNMVEINSTFYNLPSKNIVNNWIVKVPENFRFIVKVWQEITHKLDDPDIDLFIIEFFTALKPLKPKIIGFLLQFPPWFKYSESHLRKLYNLLRKIPSEYKYIIELRDNSWYNPEILSTFIDGKNIILATTYKPNLKPFYLKDQQFYYIRLIGDRELTIFNRIQRQQEKAIGHLYENIKGLIKVPNIYEIFIIVNNHFAGFAPESVNELKKKFYLDYRIFNTQKKIEDFID
ncbi:MAG: DUF72 domain-containing protein [Promethearchaeota archaeon]|jgi:uncharacterized protein YecE (DUF72 family)